MVSAEQPHAEYERLIKALRAKVKNIDDCAELIDGYGEVMNSIWSFIARLIGEGGTAAVMNRSIIIAAKDAPLASLVDVGANGIDMKRFKSDALSKGCTSPEVMDAVNHLGVVLFQTLSDLTGDALTEPLLRRLEGDKD